MKGGTRVLEFIRRRMGYQCPRLGPAYRVVRRIMPDRIDTLLFPGIRVELDLKDDTQFLGYLKGPRYETPTPDVLAEWGRSGATAFFDIGSNYGFFSYWMLWRCPEVSVYAFDPHPANYATLIQTKQRNHLTRLTPFALALGDRVDTAELRHGHPNASGGSTLAADPSLHETPRTIVSVVPFDQWCAEQHLRPAGARWIAKVDVEGYELRVLQGMKEALAARAFRGLVVEINSRALSLTGTSPDEVYGWLSDCGYRRLPIAVRYDMSNAFFVPA